MYLFLATLSILFAASILLYVILRLQAADWPPADLPPLPTALIYSTLVLAISSATMQFAVVSARRNRSSALAVSLLFTLLLGLVFLAIQSLAWMQLVDAHERLAVDLGVHPRFMLTAFYVLTALHAIHVVGGLIPLAVTTRCAFIGRYTPSSHAGVLYTAMYWHFLGIVWLALLLTLHFAQQ